MRRPKRHQSKVQQRCEFIRAKMKWASERIAHLEERLHGVRNANSELNRELALVKTENLTCQKIIDRAATIDFNRCENGYYQISVTFNGDFMGGMSRFGEDMRYIAQDVARRIEHEIASSKFVETARMNERRRMEQEMMQRPKVTPYGH